uniref:Acid phosphatase n=1 Tax=Rhizophora mucronata TaxID=61149 RepID=A0A2P2IV15_RHIMU
MSAYGHQLERQFSARSLSSRGGSDMSSRYAVESGFYMTSFAATIFIAGLATVGVLLITLLIALTVMLQTCESRSKGVVEINKKIDGYDYCRTFTLHAEMNSLGLDAIPPICKILANQHITDGQYERDLNISLWVVERYFDSIVPLGNGLDVVLMDIDDIFPFNSNYTYLFVGRSYKDGCTGCLKDVIYLRPMLYVKLLSKLQASGWSLILISRKPEKQRNATTEHLIFAGFRDWSSLIMRSEDEMEIDSREYLWRRKAILQKEGFHISGVISSQMDALTSSCLGDRIFKLPNPYYYFENRGEGTHVPE